MLIPFRDLVRKYNLKITGILHVGAHLCEEKDDYNREGISDENIYWVEGNKDLESKLKQIPNIYFELVGNKDDYETDFIITNNGQSSSILELEEHKKEHPHVWEVDRRKQKTIRLDTLLEREKIPIVNFLNLDIQGAELSALQSLGERLQDFDYIYTEVNTKYLYKNCALLGEIDSFLSDYDRVELSMTEHGWGDAFYVRRK